MRYGQSEEEAAVELERLRVWLQEGIAEIAAAHPEVTTGEIEWHGSGDEGGQESLHCAADESYVEVNYLLEKEVEEAIGEIIDFLYPGWEINEGGNGKATIDFVKRTAAIQHYHTVEESAAEAPVLITDSAVVVQQHEVWSEEQIVAKIKGANEYVLGRIQAILED